MLNLILSAFIFLGSAQFTTTKVTSCSSKLCNNEGICTQTGAQFRCECYEQFFSGDHCHDISQSCLTDILGVCHLTGLQSCIGYFGGMDCVCNPGYEGRFCEWNVGSSKLL